MIEEVEKDFYRIEIPVPLPMGYVNSYLLRGCDRNLIIDTGMDCEISLDAMLAALKELHVRLEDSDFFITHLHVDHLGLIPTLTKKQTTTIYFNRPDTMILRQGTFKDIVGDFNQFAQNTGFPRARVQEAFDSHPGSKTVIPGDIEFVYVGDEDKITVGDYAFDCICTPGHTPGHTCLYEPEKKILVSGDHVLNEITPHISLWLREGNPVKDYLESLDKVRPLNVDLVAPGHGPLFGNPGNRIEAIKSHHQARADEIIAILSRGKKTVFEVASLMTWDIKEDSFASFPLYQQMFATSEALAHLRYLELAGRVTIETTSDATLYSLLPA